MLLVLFLLVVVVTEVFRVNLPYKRAHYYKGFPPRKANVEWVAWYVPPGEKDDTVILPVPEPAAGYLLALVKKPPEIIWIDQDDEPKFPIAQAIIRMPDGDYEWYGDYVGQLEKDGSQWKRRYVLYKWKFDCFKTVSEMVARRQKTIEFYSPRQFVDALVKECKAKKDAEESKGNSSGAK